MSTPDAESTQSALHNSEMVLSLLLQDLQQSVEELARRFLGSMPVAYFQDIDPQTQLRHIKSLLASEASGGSQVLSTHNQDATVFTFISGQSYPGQLSKFIRQLPREQSLQSAKVYTALDGNWVVDMFDFGQPEGFDAESAEDREQVSQLMAQLAEVYPQLDMTTLQTHMHGCSRDYLQSTSLELLVRQFEIVDRVRCSGNMLMDLSSHPELGHCRLTFALPEADTRAMFEQVSALLGRNQINIQRAYLDSFDGDVPLSVLSFLVQHEGQPFTTDSPIWSQVAADLKRLAYLDEDVFIFAERLEGGELLDAEILHALIRLSHQLLVKRDPFIYTRSFLYATLAKYPQLALAISAQFRAKFAPNGDVDLEALRQQISQQVEVPAEHTTLQTLLAAVEATLRTNLMLPERFALALRIDPTFLTSEGREELPFGVFFVAGRSFDGFHVRFRDIARGGVRIVRPVGREQYALESERHYDECYGLASAQQLKNKDIPEGGSKGVILAKPGSSFDQVGHAYADALLDLIAPAPDLFSLHRDYLERDELLYLGPDENVSNELIVWIINRARLRGHPMPNAFMSSKPGAGINHKQYGVTSEGVTVFLETALKEVGIDPRSQPFTVKITGGPDGDVAGNEILILDREYGSNVRILGIADGSGSLEDPEGLDIDELKRLVRGSLPVSQFARSKLSPHGALTTIDQPDGIQRRNTLHNRIVADAFVPAGGRPRTINSKNWHDYLSSDGTPSSKVIVEGANLFITPTARGELGKAGVLIIKDSSANKCGVICSSYEIVSSMLLSERQFLDIKESYVAQVLDKLRELAATEAKSLLSERRLHPDADLPNLSIQLSRVINRASDLLAEGMSALRSEHPELTRRLVDEHLPEVLRQLCGESVESALPVAYLDRIMAARLASRIVYREGMSWFENRSDAEILQLAERYLQEEARVAALIASLSRTELAERGEIISLLQRGGVAAALRE